MHTLSLICLNQGLLFALIVDTVFAQKIISKCQSHILRAAVVVGAVEKYITLRDRNGDRGGNIEIDAVTDFGDKALFRAKNVACSQAKPFGEPAAGEYIDRRAKSI
jgi:hypothetical protein